MSAPRNLNTEQQSVTAMPVGVPVGTAGLDLREGAASRSPLALRECLNARFLHDRSLAKRSGHTLVKMKTNDPYPQVDVEETRPWLYGWGDLSYQAFSSAPDKPPYFPEQTRGAGVAVLDDVLIGYTGDRLLIHRTDQDEWTPSRGDLALLPTAKRFDRVYPTQTTNPFSLNAWYETAVSATNEVTLYLRNDVTNNLRVAVRDRKTGAVLGEDIVISGSSANITTGYVVYSDGMFVALWADGTDLYYAWATDREPTVWSDDSVWDTGSGEFDVEVINDQEFVVAFRDGTNIRLTYWRGRDQQQTPMAPGTALSLVGTAGGGLAIAVGRDRDIGLVYKIASGAATNQICIYAEGGTRKTNSLAMGTTTPRRHAAAAHWNYSAGGGSQFTFWLEHTAAVAGVGNVARTTSYFFSSDLAANSSATTTRVYYNAGIATRGFRVGDVALITLIYTREFPSTPNFENQYFIMAHDWYGVTGRQRCVGSFLRGESVGYNSLLSSSNFRCSGVRPEPDQGYGTSAEPTTPLWVTSLFRWPPIGLANTFSPELRQCVFYLDFLPTFRWAQYGRALYFPGAAVQTFDGRDCVEAGFLQYPEIQQVVSSAAGGSLTPGDFKAYRVYACHSNSAGEIARSSAITFVAPAVGVGHNANTITFTPIVVTSKPADEVFFEIYATTGSAAGPGATFYLVSRTTLNTFTQPTLSYVDTLPNSSLLTLPADPHPAVPGLPGELLESAPPGCELLVSAKSRLWFAGGELARGRLAFSKLREEREQVGWSALTGILDLDSSGRPVTSLASQSDVLVAFHADAVYGVQGDGPNNLGTGFFAPAQLLATGVGTDTHEGTVTSEAGIAFWAPSGPRLLTSGFQVQDVSQEVEPLARVIRPTAAVAHPGLREIRWYTAEGTALMWDYSGKGPLGNRWATWFPLPTAGAVYYPLAGGAVLCNPNGNVLIENEDEYTDGGQHFEFAFRLGDVRPGEILQGRNRFVQMAFAGEYRGEHTLGVWTFYDNARMWDDYFTWSPKTYLGPAWGSGSGTWNTDTSAWIDPATQSPDGVYRFLRRLPRDKASLLSVRVSDLGAPNNSFLIDEIAFIIAQETGLAQTPPRTFGPALSL